MSNEGKVRQELFITSAKLREVLDVLDSTRKQKSCKDIDFRNKRIDYTCTVSQGLSAHYAAALYMMNPKDPRLSDESLLGAWSRHDRFDGAEFAHQLFAREIGAPNYQALTDWAHDYPLIWGGDQGSCMLTSMIAYGVDARVGSIRSKCTTLKKVLTHWRGIESRLAKHERAKGGEFKGRWVYA